MDPITPKIGSLARIIVLIGSGIPRVRYAQVLSISPIADEHLGENGEPTLTVAFMDDPDPRKLGTADWHDQFQRHAGVRHVSHGDVTSRRVSIAWVDIIPDAGSDKFGPATVDPFKYFPQPEAAPLTATESQPAAPNNVDQARGPVNKLAVVQGIPGQHPVGSAVSVDGKLITIEDLKPGMYLEDLKLSVSTVEWHQGTLEVGTTPDAEKPEDSTPVEDGKPKGVPTLISGGLAGVAAPRVEEAGDGTWNILVGQMAFGNFPTEDEAKNELQRRLSRPNQESGENGQVVGAPAGIAPGDAAQHPPLGGDTMSEIHNGTPEGDEATRTAEQQRIADQEANGTSTDAANKGDDAPID